MATPTILHVNMFSNNYRNLEKYVLTNVHIHSHTNAHCRTHSRDNEGGDVVENNVVTGNKIGTEGTKKSDTCRENYTKVEKCARDIKKNVKQGKHQADNDVNSRKRERKKKTHTKNWETRNREK